MEPMDDVELPEGDGEQTLTDKLAYAADNLDALLAFVVGYRNKCLEQGFSEYSAECMAVDVHHQMLFNE